MKTAAHRERGTVHRVDDAALRAWPLPQPGSGADKETRGMVLVAGGSREVSGAVVLAGTAALRAGAGKLVIATAASSARTVAVAMPEARVIGLPESRGGALLVRGASLLSALKPDAVLIGPGMMGERGGIAFTRAAMALFEDLPIVLDALAIEVCDAARPFTQPVLLTPHAGEMAKLCGKDKEEVEANRAAMALAQARVLNTVIALKGACTCIALPGGTLWLHDADMPGLGTSGSGDVLAGIAAGLVARGAPVAQAAVWAVALHAAAGQRLAARNGKLGFLAREIAGEVPACMHALQGA